MSTYCGVNTRLAYSFLNVKALIGADLNTDGSFAALFQTYSHVRHYKYLQLMRMSEHIYELVGDSEKPRTLRYFSWIFTFDES